MKKNINEKIDAIFNPDAVVNVTGLKKSNPKYEFSILNTLLNCVWNSVHNRKSYSTYCIKDKVGNIIHFNDEINIEFSNDVETTVATIEKNLSSRTKPYYITTYEFFCELDSKSNNLYVAVNEYIGTTSHKKREGATELPTSPSKFTQEEYHYLVNLALNDLNRYSVTEKVFVLLHIYDRSTKKWNIRKLNA